MERPTIRLAECTLRDGSYQIDFGFTAADTAAVFAALDRAGFDEIEVGHGLGLCGAVKVGHKAGATDAEYIEAARRAATRARVGVFALPSVATRESIIDAAKRGINYLRIGVESGEPERGQEFVQLCFDQGVDPYIFFLQMSLADPKTLAASAAKVAAWGVRTIYLADSCGFLLPHQIKSYVEAVCARTDATIGFHGHNNLHLAMANCIAAVEGGATLLDCTMRGLGRSSGNPQTEALILVMERLGYRTGLDPLATFSASDQFIGIRKLGYGNAPKDIALGYAGLHSRFLGRLDKIAADYGLTPTALLLAVGHKGEPTDNMEILVEIARKEGEEAA